VSEVKKYYESVIDICKNDLGINEKHKTINCSIIGNKTIIKISFKDMSYYSFKNGLEFKLRTSLRELYHYKNLVILFSDYLWTAGKLVLGFEFILDGSNTECNNKKERNNEMKEEKQEVGKTTRYDVLCIMLSLVLVAIKLDFISTMPWITVTMPLTMYLFVCFGMWLGDITIKVCYFIDKINRKDNKKGE